MKLHQDLNIKNYTVYEEVIFSMFGNVILTREVTNWTHQRHESSQSWQKTWCTPGEF